MITQAMTTDLKKACLPDVETEMSRRYLRMLQKWIPIGLSAFEEWPVRPDCGHFFGGAHWYGQETAGPVKALALVSTSPEYDETMTGCSRDALRRIVLQGIRYLCFTHDTGPEDCLRPKKGLGRPETWGTKWGERGLGFFKESQCGNTISKITTAALILRPWVDDETWMMLAAICEDYLGRFGDMDPKSGVYADTQMEENAWTSCGLAACYLFLSNHEKAGAWEEHAKRWMFSAATVPQDRLDQAEFEDGMTVSQLTGKTFTALPDYMAENHGMVHPSYTASGVVFMGSLGNLYRLYGRQEPKHVYWNRQAIYDNLKRLTDFTGCPHCVQGMDWPYLNARCGLHGAAYLYLKDPDAGCFERISLDLAEKIQEGNKGRVVHPEVAEKCHGPQDPIVMKEVFMTRMGPPYLSHRLMGPEAPEPTSAEEIAHKLQGVKVYPHSGFVFHRHEKGQTSFSWRNEIMALPLTREGIFTVAPSKGTLLGSVSVREYAPSQKLVSLRVTEGDRGFAVAMVNDLAQESVRQKVLFASLPNGDVVCLERLIALKACTVERVEQGHLQVMNEHFPEVQGNCNGVRTLYHPDGQETFRGFVSGTADDDAAFPLDHPGWLNVDDRIGVVFEGSGKTVYLNRHYFKPYRAIADDLYLNLQDEERTVCAGDEIAQLALLLCPEQSHDRTPDRRLIKASTSEDAACLITSDYLCAGNFGSKAQVCTFRGVCRDGIPIFQGTARIKGREVRYGLFLEAGQTVFSEVRMAVTAEDAIRVEAIPQGAAFVTNEGECRTEVQITRAGQEEKLVLGAGEMARIEL